MVANRSVDDLCIRLLTYTFGMLSVYPLNPYSILHAHSTPLTKPLQPFRVLRQIVIGVVTSPAILDAGRQFLQQFPSKQGYSDLNHCLAALSTCLQRTGIGPITVAEPTVRIPRATTTLPHEQFLGHHSPFYTHGCKLASLTKSTDPSHDEPTVSTEIRDTFFSRAKARIKLSSRPRISNLHVLSAVFLFVVLLVQLLGSRNTPVDFGLDHTLSPFGDSVRRQEAYYDQLEPGTQCRPKSIFDPELPYSRAPTNMALHEEVKRMAAEFDYPPEEVNKGVKEFIRQMEEGLAKQGASMSQIPTYVTAVPNGTEKVGH